MGRAPQTDKELPASSWTPPLCLRPFLSLFDLSVRLPSHLSACAHTQTQTPRQEVRAWIPAGVPNSNQSGGTARGGRSHSSPPRSFILARSLPFSLSSFLPLSISAICPRMSWQHVRTRTHLGCTRVHTHPPLSRDFGQLTRVLCDVLQTRKACARARARCRVGDFKVTGGQNTYFITMICAIHVFIWNKEWAQLCNGLFEMCVCSREIAIFLLPHTPHPLVTTLLQSPWPPVVPLATQYTHTHTHRVRLTVYAAARLQTKRPTSDAQTSHHGSWGTCLLTPFAIFRPRA